MILRPSREILSKKWGHSVPLLMAVVSVAMACLLGALLLSRQDGFAAARNCTEAYVDDDGTSLFLQTQIFWVGHDLIVPYDGGILRVPVSDPTCAQNIFPHQNILDVVVVGDDLFAAVWTPDAHLMIYSVFDNRVLWDLPTSLPEAQLARFSQDGTRLAFVDVAPIEIWDLETGEKIDVVDIIGTITDIEFFDDNTKIALLANGGLWTHDTIARSEVKISQGSFLLFMSLDSSTHTVALLWFNVNQRVAAIKIVDLYSGDIVASQETHALFVRYSSDGRFVSTLGFNEVAVWDLEHNIQLMHGESQVSPFNQVVFRDDNRWLAVVDFQDLEKWEFWNIETGERAERVID